VERRQRCFVAFKIVFPETSGPALHPRNVLRLHRRLQNRRLFSSAERPEIVDPRFAGSKLRNSEIRLHAFEQGHAAVRRQQNGVEELGHRLRADARQDVGRQHALHGDRHGATVSYHRIHSLELRVVFQRRQI